ncbi:MAG: lipoprotein [Gammaproteobacteria bacterium]|nr:lipoprotein [Gammaproteobacteria bacterium]
MRILCVVAAAAVLVTACGQRGPLVLPGRRSHPAVVTPAPAATAPAPSAASVAREP